MTLSQKIRARHEVTRTARVAIGLPPEPIIRHKVDDAEPALPYAFARGQVQRFSPPTLDIKPGSTCILGASIRRPRWGTHE